jgi:glutathione S-transferase
MKLYWSPGSCSLAVHIALRETGLSFDMAKVDIFAKRVEDGGDFRSINPRGALPALVLDEGGVLTEVAVLLQYVADTSGADTLLPSADTLARYRVLEWLNHLASEVHKGFSILFNPAAPDSYKETTRGKLVKHFSEMNDVLADGTWLANGAYSLADIYAFVMSNWADPAGLDLSGLPALQDLRARMASRPAVYAALQAEGLA